MGEHRGKNSGPVSVFIVFVVLLVMTWACSYGPLFEQVSNKILTPLIEGMHRR